MILISEGLYFGQPITLGCDGKCSKAWGINNRPRIYLAMDEDDYCYLTDGELGYAPIDPGTYEGDQAKPPELPRRHNKWCCRECERCDMVDRGKEVEIRDYSVRHCNIGTRPAPDPANDYTVKWQKADESGEYYVNAPTEKEAIEIAQWIVSLYLHTEGATWNMQSGISNVPEVDDYA